MFGTIPFYEDQIELIFEYIFKDLKAKNPTIALAYPDTASGNISRDTCRKLTKIYNVKSYVETIISVGAGDFTSQILRLKTHNPDYVIIQLHPRRRQNLAPHVFKALEANATFPETVGVMRINDGLDKVLVHQW